MTTSSFWWSGKMRSLRAIRMRQRLRGRKEQRRIRSAWSARLRFRTSYWSRRMSDSACWSSRETSSSRRSSGRKSGRSYRSSSSVRLRSRNGITWLPSCSSFSLSLTSCRRGSSWPSQTGTCRKRRPSMCRVSSSGYACAPKAQIILYSSKISTSKILAWS